MLHDETDCKGHQQYNPGEPVSSSVKVSQAELVAIWEKMNGEMSDPLF
jgi:hypothetical protein